MMNTREQLPFEAARDVEDVNQPKLLKCTLYPTQPGGYMYVSSPAYSSGVVGRILEQLTLGIHLCAILASGPEFV